VTTTAAEIPTHAGPAVFRTWSGDRRQLLRAPWFILLLLTLLGGVLRFSFLDRPPIWSDEAMTYARICGSYQDLIDVLQFNGFVPLHYELYWWISKGMPTRFAVEQQPARPILNSRFGFFSNLRSQFASTQSAKLKRTLVESRPIVQGGIRMTPFFMRFVPALCGTLMIPALYFLAMQIASRKTALLAALFTCCSAYLLTYSRDAKMYMELWLAGTLNIACLLWWLRLRTRIAWLCWVASGVAMCGLHAPGMILLGIGVILFLTLDRQWWPSGLILLGGFVLSGLIFGQTSILGFHYDARWDVIGAALLISIGAYVGRRGPHDWKAIAFFLLGLGIILSGPVGYYGKFNQYVDRLDEYGWQDSGLGWIDSYNRTRTGAELLIYTSTAFLTSWEWPRAVDERLIDLRVLRLLHGAVYVLAGALALGAISLRRSNRARDPLRLLWIMAWIAVPAYFTYCVSMARGSRMVGGIFIPSFDSPLNWFAAMGQLPGAWLFGPLVFAALLTTGAVFFAGNSWRERINRSLKMIVAIACVLAMCFGVYLHLRNASLRATLNGDRWHSIWMPRYLGVVWPAIAITVSALLLRLPTRPLRAASVAFLIAVNLALFGARVFADNEPPSDRLAADAWAAQPDPNNTFRAYGSVLDTFGMAPGLGVMFTPPWRYYLVLYSGQSTTPTEMRAFRSTLDRRFVTYTDIRPVAIAYDLAHHPQLQHIVVWDRLDSYRADPYQSDPLKALLAQDWRRIDERIFTARDHWTWMKLYECRRREYVRMHE
jgi:hypothetical protein